VRICRFSQAFRAIPGNVLTKEIKIQKRIVQFVFPAFKRVLLIKELVVLGGNELER
jgi:hypothetical protein